MLILRNKKTLLRSRNIITLLVLIMSFYACKRNGSEDNATSHEKNDTIRKVNTGIGIKTKDSLRKIMIDTDYDGYKISLFYIQPFKYLNDSFEFRGIIHIEKNKLVREDTLILSTTDVMSGLQRMVAINGPENVSLGRLFVNDNLVFISLVFYPGKVMYVINIADDKSRLIKTKDDKSCIYSENGYVLGTESHKFLSFYANRGTRDYNGILYRISSGIDEIKRIMLNDNEYNDSSLIQTKNGFNKIYDKYLK